MSTQNDLINYQNVIKEANSLINEQIKLWGGVVSSIQQVGKVTPSSFVNAQKQVNEALIKSTELTDKQRLADIRLQQAREKAFDRYEAKLKKELVTEAKQQAQLAKSENLYNKIQAKVNQLTQTYNNLAAKKELGLNLTTKELAQLNSLEGRLNKYNGVLKQVDATIGKNQRNVGNYASGWDGLGNSINQITRELPAFTYSAQTGFMALSNNIPILADEIQRVSQNVAKMRAEGKQVPGVMSQILTSFLSWQTALSLSVTLITVYGKEIGAFFNKMMEGSKKVDKATQSLNAYNEALKSDEYTTAYKNVLRIGDAFEQAEKGTLKKEKALKLYNDTLGNSIGEAKTYNEALEKYTDNADNYIQATIKMAAAQSFLERAAKASAEAIELGSEKAITISEKFTAYWDNLNEARSGDEAYSKNMLVAFAQAYRGAMDAGKANNIYTKAIENRQKGQEKANEDEKTAIELAKQMLSDINSLTSAFDISGKKSEKAISYIKDRITAEYELQKIQLERQRDEAKYAEDMETYFLKNIQLANLEYEHKKTILKLTEKDKETLNTRLLVLEEERLKNIEEIGRSEIAQQEEVFKKIGDAIKKYWDLRKKAAEEGAKKEREATQLKGELQDLDNAIEIESLGGNRGSKYWELQKKSLDDWYENQKELHRNNAQELLKIDKEYELQKLQLQNDRKNAFKQAMTEMYSSALGDMGAGSLAQFFNGQFEEIWAGAETLQEKMAAVMMAIGDIASDVFDAMSESQNAYFQQQFANLETEKDLALQFAGENTAGREAIEKQYNEKKRALQMQQAKQEKQMAMIQATINIAQGITSALAQAPPYSFILAGLVGVLGAVQLARISSTPLPQFYTGTSNAPEGLALTQERGAEMITDKNGNIKTLGNNKGAQLTYLNKGDKVFTADETTQKLNELLISSGVSPIVNVSGGSGMSKEDMREVLNDTLAKQPKNSITFDENGIKAFTSKENRRTILKNRNVKI